MKPLVTYSEGLVDDDFQIIVNVNPVESILMDCFEKQPELKELYSTIIQQEQLVNQEIDRLEREADRLTSHADGMDYSVATACGILCGLIDSFFVGAFDYKSALENAKGSNVENKIDNAIKETAEKLRLKDTIQQQIEGKKFSKEQKAKITQQIKEGLQNTFNNLEQQDAENKTLNGLARAIKKLEEHFPLPLDNAFQNTKGINALSHHLDDWAHHPTPMGMIAAIVGTFFRFAIMTDKNGKWHLKFIK